VYGRENCLGDFEIFNLLCGDVLRSQQLGKRKKKLFQENKSSRRILVLVCAVFFSGLICSVYFSSSKSLNFVFGKYIITLYHFGNYQPNKKCISFG